MSRQSLSSANSTAAYNDEDVWRILESADCDTSDPWRTEAFTWVEATLEEEEVDPETVIVKDLRRQLQDWKCEEADDVESASQLVIDLSGRITASRKKIESAWAKLEKAKSTYGMSKLEASERELTIARLEGRIKLEKDTIKKSQELIRTAAEEVKESSFRL